MNSDTLVDLRDIRGILQRAVDRMHGALKRHPIPEHAEMQAIRDAVAGHIRHLGRLIEPEA